MLKRIFSVFFAFLLSFLIVLPVFNVSAYEVNGFEITANAGMLVSLDTNEVLYSKNADKKIYPAAITNIMAAIVFLESEKYSPDG